MSEANGTARAVRQVRPGSLAFVLIMAALMTVTAMSIDINLPAIPAIAADLGASVTTAQLTVPLFFAGFAVGQVIWGPLSDLTGRRPAMLTALAIYLASTVACALSTSIEMLLAMRMIQGFAAGGGSTIARAVIRDLFTGAEMARIMSLTMAVFILAPIVAPSIGALLLLLGPWQIIFWFLVAYGSILIVLAITRLAESLPERNPRALHPTTLLTGYVAILRERSSHGPALMVILTMCAMQSYLTNVPVVLMEMRGMSPNEFGAVFAVVGTFTALGSLANARAVRHMKLTTAIKTGIAGSCIGAGLNLLVVLMAPEAGWGLVPGFAMFFFWFGWIAPNATALFLMPHGSRVGTAVSVMGVLQIAIPAVFASCLALIHANSPLPLMLTMLGSQLLAGAILLTGRGVPRPA